MIENERVPLAEACRLVGGDYLKLWRGVTSGVLPAEKRHGCWWVSIADVAAFAHRSAKPEKAAS